MTAHQGGRKPKKLFTTAIAELRANFSPGRYNRTMLSVLAGEYRGAPSARNMRIFAHWNDVFNAHIASGAHQREARSTANEDTQRAFPALGNTRASRVRKIQSICKEARLASRIVSSVQDSALFPAVDAHNAAVADILLAIEVIKTPRYRELLGALPSKNGGPAALETMTLDANAARSDSPLAFAATLARALLAADRLLRVDNPGYSERKSRATR